MKAQLNRVSLALTLSLSGLMGGCGLFGGGGTGDVAVQPAPQPTAPQAFPRPGIPVANSPAKVLLTRPTDPDARLRVIKTGRNDPFGLLVAPQTGAGASNAPAGNPNKTVKITTTQPPANGGGGSTNVKVTTQPGRGKSNSPDVILSRFTTALPNLSPSAQPHPSSGSSKGSTGTNGGLTLPALPPKPELASVKVMGVVNIAGTPRAIVEAPGESTSRTVGVGDSLSNGQLYVRSIDTSSREPVVVFQQGDIAFSVAVGRAPVLVASVSGPRSAMNAPNSLPVRGLYSVSR